MRNRYVTWTHGLVILSLLAGVVGGSMGRTVSLSQAAAPQSTLPPIVIQQSPEPGQELGLKDPIEIVFDRSMDHQAVEQAFSLTPAVSGSFQWPDERTVQFHPGSPLERDQSYSVRVAQNAKALDGTALEDPYTFRFRTVGYLEITQVIPAADSTDVEVQSGLTVMFNRPVVPLTSLSQQDGLAQPLAFDPPVPGRGEWLNTSVYQFKPDKTLVGGAKYTVTAKAGLTDTTGGLLANDYSWAFTTQPPQIVWVSPNEGDRLIAPTTSIRITFNQEVDCGSLQEAFTLKKLFSPVVVSGKFTCSGTTIDFQPDRMLDFRGTYLAKVDAGVTGAVGQIGMAESKTWQFAVVPLPRIESTSPSNGDRQASPYTSFNITFNAPIDPATVMPNLSFTPPISPTQVYTYWSEWNQTFSVQFGARPSTDYQVVIGAEIRDPYGNATGQRMHVRFRTQDLPPQVQLLVPGQVSTQNAEDPARIFVRYTNTPQLNFRLYRLKFTEMTKALSNWYEYQPPSNALVRKWTERPESPLNETLSLPIDLTEEGSKLQGDIYMLQVSAPNIEQDRWGHQHIVVVSKVNLTLKTSGDQALVWATDMNSGAPVAGLPLWVTTRDAVMLGDSTTKADGSAAFDLPSANSSELYFASDSPFALVSPTWNEGIYVGNFGYESGSAEAGLRHHVYTDRPIYRAGQTVYFRGILRQERDVAYSLPTTRQVKVAINDPTGQAVFNKTLSLDKFGSFQGEIALAQGAALGYYSIVGSSDNQSFSTNFQVAAYRPPEFEVQVKPQVPAVVAGEPTTATVNVSYFFGGAVANVPVEWHVLSEPYVYRSEQFGRYSFADTDDPWVCFDCWWRPSAPPTPILNGRGTTDVRGQLVIDLPGNIASLGAPATEDTGGVAPKDVASKGLRPIGSRQLTVEATVSGTDGSVVSGRSAVIVHQGAFYIGLAPQQMVGHSGKNMAVDVVTVDWNDNRFPGQALDVEVHRLEWVNTFVENQLGGGQWKWDTKDELVGTQQIATNANAEAAISFKPEKGGSYRIVVKGRDETERLVQSSVFVWVSSPETVSWRRENNDRINLITDKASYAVGETAEILIPSPFEGKQWALVTVERGSILSYDVLEMTSNSTVYRLPIKSEHLPNIYVSAVIIKGKDATNKATAYKVGYAAVQVKVAPVKLNLTVKPGTVKAGPGESVELQVQVTDASGQPVETQLSLDVVDKAVLSLSPRQPDAILEAFYGRRGLGVNTATGLSMSLNRLVLEQLAEAQAAYGKDAKGELHDNAVGAAPAAPMAMEEAMPTAAAGMRKAAVANAPAPAPPPGIAIRQEFADTAYWNGAVATDPNGRASVTVKLPDNLTTWVVRGVGITQNTLVGEGLSDVLVTKPLLIRPISPRFFVVGDQMQLAASVSNNTESDRDVQVTLSATGLDVISTPQQTITVKAGAEAKTTWDVAVPDSEQVEVIFSAVSGEYSDAAKPRLTTGPDGTLLVRRYTAPDIVGTGGQLDGAGSRTELVALPPRYDNRQGELSVRLDPSLAAGMTDGLTYLKHFPYECTEQTVSRFLPNVLTYRALKQLGITNKDLEENLPGLVKQGLDKLYMQQHEDGGWGWWPDGQSNPHVSAYVVFALNKALEAQFGVKAEVLNRGREFLRAQLTPADGLKSYREANQQAFILYVLTDSRGGAGRFGPQIDDLYQTREKLSHYGKALLAMSIGKANVEDSRINTLLSDLQNSAILSATGAHWEENDYDWWAMNTDTRSTAIILEALTRLNPDNALNPNVVRWLMVARKDGIWETTQETAWALIALTDWMVETGELQGEYDYRATLNGKELASGGIDSSNVRSSIALKVQIADLLKDQSNRLTISRGEGPGRLYYTAHLKVYLPVEEIQPADRGISVYREYTTPDCQPGDKCPAVKEAQVGDVVQVRLTLVVPHDRYYVMVEDPLPAGAEAIDKSLATTSVMEGGPRLSRQPNQEDSSRPYKSYYDYWWWRWYSRTEMRDDRVVLFADYLPAGTYEYTYTFRAYLPGQYRVIPTVANEMYFPEVFGRSDGRLFTIK